MRIKTGIEGFDKLIQGGIPAGFNVLLVGSPGTGKTLFALEYAYNGVTKYKQKSMYITFEQTLQDIRDQAKGIGMDLLTEEKGNLTLMHVPFNSITTDTIEHIKKEVTKRKIKRLVVDSLSTLAVNAPVYTPIKDLALRDIMNYKAFFSPPVLGEFVVKRFIYGFLSDLKSLGCTTIIVTEAPEKGDFISRDTVSEFQADSVIQIKFESLGGEFSRSLLIRKMRGTNADQDMHPLEISNKGLKVHKIE